MRPFAPTPLVRRRDPFDDRRWIYEPKLDGFRALPHADRGECRLVSRNGHEFRSWPTLCHAIAASIRAQSAILDGEIACVDAAGRPNFQREPDLPWE